MSELRIRAYNVQFGDAFLITFPDSDDEGNEVSRSILIDVGNVNRKEGGSDALFQPVINNVLQELDEQPLDLYVMTHEHLDHVQGLPYAENKFYDASETELKDALKTKYAWLTASAHPDYYEEHSEAEKRHLKFSQIFSKIDAYLKARIDAEIPIPDPVRFLWLNNNPFHTADCVSYLRDIAEKTFYVHRETPLENKHPFNEAELEIWAPEEDTTDYYGKFQPTPLNLNLHDPNSEVASASIVEPQPPGGVDAGTFYKLLNIHRGYLDNLLAIDKAANNTSVVICLKWSGMRFLFTGDAELRSWRTMNEHNVLKQVNFLKVSHHASHNGTPPPEILDKILTKEHEVPEGCALISTYEDVYNNVPDGKVIDRLKKRCSTIINVDSMVSKEGGYVDISFDKDGNVTIQTSHQI